MGNKSSKFGLGVIVGVIIGGITGLLLSPSTGKDNREYAIKYLAKLKRKLDDSDTHDKIKEIFGQVTDEGEKIFDSAKKEITNQIAIMKEKYGDPQDPVTYVSIVEEGLKIVEKKLSVTSDQIAKLKKYFSEEEKA